MLELLNILADRSNYERFSKYITKYVVPEETWKIIQAMGDWFNEDSRRMSIADWSGMFATWFLTIKYPSLPEDKQILYRTIFDSAKTPILDDKVRDNIVENYILREHGSKIADVALKIAEGSEDFDIEDIQIHVDSYRKESSRMGKEDEHVVTTSFIEIVEELDKGKGLHWRLPFLNKSIGSLRKGNLVVTCSRPEVGKTSFMASESTYMAPQCDSPVLWFNNEQEAAAVRTRFYTTALGKSYTALKSDPVGAVEAYRKLIPDPGIILIDKADMSMADIKRYCEKYKPGLIVIDQLWKVHGFEKDRNSAQQMAALFRAARELSKTYAPVMVAHQADPTAEGEKWIDMYQLYESKTALQGEADVILTIGKTNDPGCENRRYINIPKNKLPTPEVPELRHGKTECIIDFETGRFI